MEGGIMSSFRRRLMMASKYEPPLPPFTYRIKFNGNWRGTSIFNNIFELLDANFKPVQTATVDTKYYRFRAGKENWNGINTIYEIFKTAVTLVRIELPPDWNSVDNISNLFGNCINLEEVIFPKTFGKIRYAGHIFAHCPKITRAKLPMWYHEMLWVDYIFRDNANFVNITMPIEYPPNANPIGMFQGTGFTSKALGIISDDGLFVSSPADGVFPVEVWKLGIGLDYLK